MNIVNSKDLPPAILKFSELLCGCGNPELCWDWLLSYLEKVEVKNFEQFNSKSGTEYLAAYVMNTQCKITTHGGCILYSWLTSKGQDALSWLQKNGAEYAGSMVVDYS